jgi:hypothetical protein
VPAQLNSLADVQQLFADRPVKDVTAWVNRIAEIRPEFFQNFALVYRSRSLQRSSLEQPRVIAFGKDKGLYGPPSQLFMAFSSLDDRVELMGYDDKANDFRFAELRFPQGLQTEPAECRTCHQGKPIWDSYSVWPGVYGSLNDRMRADIEAPAFRKYLESAPKDPLLKHFVPRVSPARDFTANGPSASFELEGSPLARLTGQFSYLGFRRQAAKLKSLPEFARVAPALHAGAGSCHWQSDWAPRFFPESLRAAAQARVAEITRQVDRQYTADSVAKLRRFFEVGDRKADVKFYFDNLGRQYTRAISNFWMLLHEAGGDLSDWSLVLSPNALDFLSPGSGFLDLQNELNRAFGGPPDCTSQVRATELHPFHWDPVANRDKQAVLARCLYCHPGWENVEELRAKKAKIATRLDDMPPAPHRPLTDAERDSFRALIERL